MLRSKLPVLLALLSGCTFITDVERAERRDLDGDGVGYVDGEGQLDCDDQDGSVQSGLTFYADLDGDGFGDEDASTEACAAPEGYVDNADDCDDSDAAVSPDAIEQCNGNDDNCNGLDDDGAEDVIWYLDGDKDGFGDDSSTFEACEAPPGYVAQGGDCDDTEDLAYPDAPENCDGFDNDCDGAIDRDDDDAVEETYYADADGDGFGDADAPVQACGQPSQAVDNSDDCDDADAAVSPDALEVCNAKDDDCDGAIDDADDSVSEPDTWFTDADGDGFGDDGTEVLACARPTGMVADGGDCNDDSAAQRPGAPEVCNDVDDDCNGEVDDATDAGVFWYADTDEDGYGDGFDAVAQCAQPDGFVDNDGDCDDTAAAVNPDADEVCDGVDNNCDQRLDEKEAVDATDYFIDGDGDGVGSDAASQRGCSTPAGFADSSGDCDDGDVLVAPGLPELCDGVDNDCDGAIDNDAQPVDWYADVDGDGFGDVGDSLSSCDRVDGRVLDGADCVDSDADINPAAIELCDEIDNDCDGAVDSDDDDAAETPYYADADGDGYGVDSDVVEACGAPDGYTLDGGDCDDDSDLVNPGVAEVCNGTDDDCDAKIDDADPSTTGKDTWYADLDGDTFGDLSSPKKACEAPTDFIADGTDCDDTTADVSPAADEVCDELDNNCDGEIDENTATDAATWYIDSDGDGSGTSADTVQGCALPDGFSADADDCDDTEPTTFPGAAELCDTRDNNCDGLVDNDVATFDYFADVDGDSFGDPTDSLNDCKAPAGYISNNQDCNDADPAVNPDADELCDGIDNDCDTRLDDADPDVVDATDFYGDSDGDGFGDSNQGQLACAQPSGHVADDSDCDDSNGAVYPGAAEICDSIDNDCDTKIDDADAGVTGRPDWARDFDKDDFGDASITVKACVAPGGYIADQSDCDDAQALVNPAADEVCDGIDNNCDGAVDEDTATDAATWYVDGDGDAFGLATSSTEACAQPTGYVDNPDDCDDADELTNPDAVELCDEIDNDCNTVVDDGVQDFDFFADTDGDTYGDPNDTLRECKAPPGYVGNQSDCDDGRAAVNPAATEVCNSLDDDCDGAVDAADPSISDADTYFRDADADSYGDAANDLLACSDPGAGWSSDDTDCDDTRGAVNPGGTEVCANGLDDDCDGTKGTCVGWDGDVDLGAPGQPVLVGETAGERSGTAVAWVPDLNGDGLDDIAVGAPDRATAADNGSVYLKLSAVVGEVDLATAELRIDGDGYTEDTAEFGRRIAVGDVDGNGQADLLVAAHRGFNPQDRERGNVWLFMNPWSNKPADVEDATAWIFGRADGDRFGSDVAMGDFDGDGFADLLVGAPRWDQGNLNDVGQSYVLYGPSITGRINAGSASARIIGGGQGNRSGTSVASAGDMDGDGLDDMLIGEPRYSAGARRRGAAYVVAGGASGDLNLQAGAYEARLIGEAQDHDAGEAVAGAGDVNGDGYADILIGAPGYGNDAGAAYLFLGPISGSQGLAGSDSRLVGETAGDRAGESVASAGDGDGDGFSEVFVGAPRADSNGNGDSGIAYIMRGPFSGNMSLGAADTRLLGVNGERTGDTLAGGGDHNGDGYDDVLLGAPRDARNGGDAGATWIIESAGGL